MAKEIAYWLLVLRTAVLLVVVSICIGTLHHINSPDCRRLEEDTAGEGNAEVVLRRSIVG
jgi:hypothetical protein